MSVIPAHFIRSRFGPAAIGALVLASLCATAPATAQEPVEFWTEAAVRYEPVKDLDLTLGYAVRMDARELEVDRFFPEAGVRYEVLDWLRLGVGYRLIRDRRGDTSEFQTMHRYHFDASTSFDVLDDFEVGFRARIQRQHSRTANKNRLELAPEFRTRVSVEYERHDVVRPEVSWELFMPWGPESHRGFHAHEWRVKFALGLRLGDHDLAPFYHLERRIDDRVNIRTHVVGLEYRYSF